MLLLATQILANYYVAMRRVTRHLRVGIMALIAVLIGVVPGTVSATTLPNTSLSYAAQPDVFITELQTYGSSASQEFVELYNATDHDITFGDSGNGEHVWKLQTFSSATPSDAARTWLKPTYSLALSGTISAHDYYTVSPTGYAPGGVDLTGQGQYGTASSNYLADAGGGLQLIEIPDATKPQDVVVHDQMMWLAKPSANVALPAGVLQAPDHGKSLQRLPNDDNEYINDDNTLTDYGTSADPTPLDSWQAPIPIVMPDPIDTTPTGGSDPVISMDPTNPTVTTNPGTILTSDPVDNTDLSPPQITELLPNPASPLTDAADEFIELYNPNDAPFDLKGYSLEVGTTTLHDFNFTDDVVLPAGAYQAFYSAATHLSLVNSSGQARLLDARGTKVSETDAYNVATDGTAWELYDGSWQWTTTPTPSSENVLTSTPISTKTVTAKTTTAKTAAVKATTAKVAAKKAVTKTTTKKAVTKKVAVKKTKKKAAVKKTTTLATAAIVKPKPPIHTGILVGVAVVAVLYGVYEYRHDISNKFRQFRDNRAARGKIRRQTAWR